MENDAALHIASQSGFLETAEVLLELGADVNLRTDTNASALHLAANGGHVDIARLLINNKGKISWELLLGINAVNILCSIGVSVLSSIVTIGLPMVSPLGRPSFLKPLVSWGGGGCNKKRRWGLSHLGGT